MSGEDWSHFDGPRGPSCKPVPCPDCGRFSAASWAREVHGPDGYWTEWGGVCKSHGRWSDSS